MKKILLTMVILLGVSFGYAQQYRANGTGWTLKLFCNEDENQEELGIGLFEDGQNPWDEEEMEIDMDFLGIQDIIGGGLFGRGANPVVGSGYRTNPFFGLPTLHGYEDDVNAPLGSGVLLLVGFGAAYLVGKKRREE